MSSVFCFTICNSFSLFPSRPVPHHPTSSHLSHHSYIFISLGFTKYRTWHYLRQRYRLVRYISECRRQHNFPCRTATASAFTPSAAIAFVQLDRTLKNLIGSQGQMMADDHTDFTVEQDGGVGLNVQNIGSGTGGNLEHKKFK